MFGSPFFTINFAFTGVSEPRGGFNSSLPSALNVSESIQFNESYSGIQKNFTEMILIWGDFITNDLSVVAKYTSKSFSKI